MLKIFTAILWIHAFGGLQTHDPSYGDCSFACKEIPLASEVLRKFGNAHLPQLGHSRLKILAWNIYKGEAENFFRDFSRLSANKDIILISEATTADPVVSALNSVPGFGWDFAVSFLMKKQVGTGTSVGSYAKSFNSGFYRTIDVEPFVKSPKTITRTEFALPNSNQKLMVLSIHGINWSGDDALERQLQMTMADLKKHDGPIVFAGDFNIKNSTRLKVASDILAAAGLQRVTWMNPEQGNQRNDAFTRGLVVHRAELVMDVVGSGSDHPAIELDIEF